MEVGGGRVTSQGVRLGPPASAGQAEHNAQRGGGEGAQATSCG